MRKFILPFLMLAIVGMMGLSSCNGCSKGGPDNQASHDYDGVVQDFTAGVGNIQSLHRQTMYTLAGGKDYEWRNSKVLFNDTITMENIGELHVTDVTDVFQYIGEDVLVQIISSNVKQGTVIPYPIHDIWIEDSNLSELEIRLGAEDALLRLKEWNGVLPVSASMSLRCPVGPKKCNAQWVIGNIYDVIFIDAVTGDIATSNPAF